MTAPAALMISAIGLGGALAAVPGAVSPEAQRHDVWSGFRPARLVLHG
ncbi:MAG: hypothetical protein AVDCRST_MAG70-2526, partial [uncultured Thermomicrobiales bacterium]